jgi:hypothetical protein
MSGGVAKAAYAADFLEDLMPGERETLQQIARRG